MLVSTSTMTASIAFPYVLRMLPHTLWTKLALARERERENVGVSDLQFNPTYTIIPHRFQRTPEFYETRCTSHRFWLDHLQLVACFYWYINRHHIVVDFRTSGHWLVSVIDNHAEDICYRFGMSSATARKAVWNGILSCINAFNTYFLFVMAMASVAHIFAYCLNGNCG